jgi:steroid 5-alpha reductase family enzyme
MDIFYFIAILGSAIIMAGAFLIEQKTGASGHIDSIWTLNIGFFSILAAIPFNDFRAILIVALVAFWALRLGGHIFQRTNKSPDDPRYSEIKKSWGKRAAFNLFWFLQIQAICAFVLISAVRLGVNRGSSDWQFIDFIALFVAIIGISGEAIADNQLRFFKANNPPNSICNIGLWRFSRHPNYFFEFVFWCGISLFAFDFNEPKLTSIFAIIAPLMMYYLLNYASGIPPLEAYMLKSRGEKFENYMRTTRPFFPFPK